jgi:hypothetical protein
MSGGRGCGGGSGRESGIGGKLRVRRAAAAACTICISSSSANSEKGSSKDDRAQLSVGVILDVLWVVVDCSVEVAVVSVIIECQKKEVGKNCGYSA